MNRICQAVTKSTKIQCKKNALLGSKYCFYHIDKRPILISLIIGAVISLLSYGIWYKLGPSKELTAINAQSNINKKNAKEAEKRAQELSGQLLELSARFSQVQTQLDPFINLANERYPNIGLADALSKLNNDIKNVREIASRDIFKYPNELIKNKTVYALKQWKEKHPNLLVKIEVLNGSTPYTGKVLDILCWFLTSSYIESECIRGSLMSFGRTGPISIYTSNEFKNAADLLLKALGNYVSGEIYYGEKSENKFIEIQLNGNPKFYSNGNVILERNWF